MGDDERSAFDSLRWKIAKYHDGDDVGMAVQARFGSLEASYGLP